MKGVNDMKRIIVALLITLLISCSILSVLAEETDWYYPFELNKNSTYQEALDTILSIYPTKEIDIYEYDDHTLLLNPKGMLFGIPIDTISISFERKDSYYKSIYIFLTDIITKKTYKRYSDALRFMCDNSKSSPIIISPIEVIFDSNGNPVVKTFLDEFSDDYLINTTEFSDYVISWIDKSIWVSKDNLYLDIILKFDSENQ